jgi:hypothetical protein
MAKLRWHIKDWLFLCICIALAGSRFYQNRRTKYWQQAYYDKQKVLSEFTTRFDDEREVLTTLLKKHCSADEWTEIQPVVNQERRKTHQRVIIEQESGVKP